MSVNYHDQNCPACTVGDSPARSVLDYCEHCYDEISSIDYAHKIGGKSFCEGCADLAALRAENAELRAALVLTVAEWDAVTQPGAAGEGCPDPPHVAAARAVLAKYAETPETAETAGKCGCICCLRERDKPGELPAENRFMVLCAKCGNKRCPHATDHRLACTHSNDPGQPGSVFQHVRSPKSFRGDSGAMYEPLTTLALAELEAALKAIHESDYVSEEYAAATVAIVNAAPSLIAAAKRLEAVTRELTDVREMYRGVVKDMRDRIHSDICSNVCCDECGDASELLGEKSEH